MTVYCVSVRTCVYVCVCVCVCMCVHQPLRMDRVWHNVNILVEYIRFEFRIVLLLDWLPNQG